MVFDHTYSQVCWNNCHFHNGYDIPDVHAGDVEVGDSIVIDWEMMEPKPSEVMLIEVDNGEEVSEEIVSSDDSTITIEVVEQDLGNQYSIQYLWRDGKELIGQSSLNFKLK